MSIDVLETIAVAGAISMVAGWVVVGWLVIQARELARRLDAQGSVGCARDINIRSLARELTGIKARFRDDMMVVGPSGGSASRIPVSAVVESLLRHLRIKLVHEPAVPEKLALEDEPPQGPRWYPIPKTAQPDIQSLQDFLASLGKTRATAGTGDYVDGPKVKDPNKTGKVKRGQCKSPKAS